MIRSSRFVVPAILLALAGCRSMAPPATGASAPGGYIAIDPADPDVTAAADYAVSEQTSRGGAAVALRRVARAERQVVAGYNYRLCLEVTVAGKPEEVRSIVYRNLQQRFSLTRWSPGACATP